MKALLSRLFAGCLMAAICLAGTVAQGKAKKENKKRAADPTTRVTKKLESAGLPTDVLDKAKQVVKENAAKIREAQARVDSILTTEQKNARAAAQKAAKESGKKKKEAAGLIQAAMKLTPEQKTQLAAAERDLRAAQSAMNSGLKSVLSPEQLAKVGIKAKKKNA